METKINIAAILKDKPRGTKLYSPIFGNLRYEDLVPDLGEFTIITSDNTSAKHSFWSDGRYNRHGEPLMLLPSKEMRDWRKFFKKGDVLVNKDRDVHVIFERFVDDTYCFFVGKYYLWKENNDTEHFYKNERLLTSDFQKAGEDSAQTYISTIEERLGGKLNRETLEIEKTQPEFKDGDDKHIVYPLNFMPRKECCCELDYDLSDKGQKEEYLKQLRDSQERLKILSLLLHKQEEEVIEFGYPKTTCYYPDLNCLKEIDFKEDKQ